MADESQYMPGYRGPDGIAQALPIVGQLNPKYERKFTSMYGRPLMGLGSNALLPMNDPAQDSGYLDSLEARDDASGSGIFDPPGRAANLHPTLGIFADHASVPGYISREEQFAINREISNPDGDSNLVVVPAGGMTFREYGGRVVPFDGLGAAIAPSMPAYVPVEQTRSIVNYGTYPQALGAEESGTPRWLIWGLLGVAAGAGAAMFMRKRR